MTGSKDSKTPRREGRKQASGDSSRSEPEWAAGLKQLYDSVVEEPLPDSFKDLLAKLDDDGRA